MQATPLFLGACALASIAGVVGGTTINTDPIQRGGIGMDEFARPSIDYGAQLSEERMLPDHYALVTPEGRVDVAELSTRGLYGQRRYGWEEPLYTPPPLPALEEDDYGSDPVELTAYEPTEAAVQVAATAQQEIAERPLPEADQQGEARLIDVDLALAES